jgi:hypothetical protein
METSLKNLPPSTHQKTKTPEYRAWQGMRARCLYNKAPQYKDYGGRGITICERWNSFENFLADMGNRPDKNYSIERENVNGNYEPWNCVWADWNTQARNRRNTRNVVLNGITMCVSEAVKILDTHDSKIIRMVRRFDITHQEAIDLYSSSPKNHNFRDFQKTLNERKSTSAIAKCK